jgi:hypothetical protein
MLSTSPTVVILPPDTDPEIAPQLAADAAARGAGRLTDQVPDAFAEATEYAIGLCAQRRRGQPISEDDRRRAYELEERTRTLRARLTSDDPASRALERLGFITRVRGRLAAHLETAATAIAALEVQAISSVADGPRGQRELDAIATAMQTVRDQLRPWFGAAGMADQVPPTHHGRIPDPATGTRLTAEDVRRRVGRRLAAGRGIPTLSEEGVSR